MLGQVIEVHRLCVGELTEAWLSLAHSGSGFSLIQPHPE